MYVPKEGAGSLKAERVTGNYKLAHVGTLVRCLSVHPFQAPQHVHMYSMLALHGLDQHRAMDGAMGSYYHGFAREHIVVSHLV